MEDLALVTRYAAKNTSVQAERKTNHADAI